ncbi:4521_t:CDS:2, partial [Entrophospora sp. SA101]
EVVQDEDKAVILVKNGKHKAKKPVSLENVKVEANVVDMIAE